MVRRAIYIVPLIFSMVACDSKDWEAAGHQDGYASTINTACRIRGTAINGVFDNVTYARGYSRGANAAALEIGSLGCDAIRRSYGITRLSSSDYWMLKNNTLGGSERVALIFGFADNESACNNYAQLYMQRYNLARIICQAAN
jgi:hypothetical protein